jgi:D-glycero-D-manno-heptose 1,7-bisphosphate phosphatase
VVDNRQIAGKPAVFFDRDGVLNHAVVADGKPRPPKDADDLRIVEGAKELLSELKKRGFFLACVTNQPDVARGTRTMDNVNAMNEKVRAVLPLDDFRVCFHDNGDNCPCRKPKPGMLLSVAEMNAVDLKASYMVGDRTGDVGAGRSAGTKTVFIDFDYDEPKPDPPPDFTCRSLEEAVKTILKQKADYDAHE